MPEPIKKILAYVVGAAMVAVGAGSILLNYLAMLGWIDATAGIPSLDMSMGIFFAGLSMLGWRMTEEHKMQQTERLIVETARAGNMPASNESHRSR